MTPDTRPSNSNCNERDAEKSLHITPTTPHEAEQLAHLTALAREIFSEDAVTVVDQDQTESWSGDEQCPNCHGEEIRVLRARNDTYEYDTGTNQLEYTGLVQETAVEVGTPMRVTCTSCDAVLVDTALFHLTSYDTL
jgi:hypothetical protein